MAQKFPLMPKQTAIWLIDNTTLTFKQIGEYCGLHPAEIEAIADGIVAAGMKGENPVANEELTAEEIQRCEGNSDAALQMHTTNRPEPRLRAKGPKYTPVSKRGDKPNAIMFLLKYHPEFTDAQIVKLIGTTKNTINNIRDRTHANISEFKPQSPTDLGLVSYLEFDAAVKKALAKAEKEGRIVPKTAEAPNTAAATEETSNTAEKTTGFDFSNFLGENTGS